VAYYLFNFTRKNARPGVPLADQAAELLAARLWGIGAKTPNKDRLSEGDRFLAYVGAPEQCLVGHGALAGGVHSWTPAEAASYPGDWPAGVALAAARVWEESVPIDKVWPSMPSSANNPNAQFFSGVVQIKEKDYQVAVAAVDGGGGIGAPSPPIGGQASAASVAPSSKALAGLYATTEKLRQFLAASSPKKLTEEATRALFIDPMLQALGYTGFEDIDYGVKVETKDVADYVLNVEGEPAIVVEAKRLDTKLDAMHAAQVIKYASVMGVRWGLLTNGRVVQLFDRIPNVSPLERLVFEVDLVDCADREEFEVKLFPDMSLLLKSTMAEGSGLDRRAAQKAVRDLLTTTGSAALEALRVELAESQLAHLSSAELAELTQELL
jgi:Type I restriction enzyme R protein N terminus (HSDR_N)